MADNRAARRNQIIPCYTQRRRWLAFASFFLGRFVRLRAALDRYDHDAGRRAGRSGKHHLRMVSGQSGRQPMVGTRSRCSSYRSRSQQRSRYRHYYGLRHRIGAMPIELGIAVVLGANIGTCATALLASIGGTKAGQYVAWSHVVLNAGGALLFMPFIGELAAAIRMDFLVCLPVKLPMRKRFSTF